MVTLYDRDFKSDWKAWALNISIGVISFLAALGIYFVSGLVKDMRAEIMTEIKEIHALDNNQEKCIAELKVDVNNLKKK